MYLLEIVLFWCGLPVLRAADLVVFDGGSLHDGDVFTSARGHHAPLLGGLYAAGADSTIVRGGLRAHVAATSDRYLSRARPTMEHVLHGGNVGVAQSWALGDSQFLRNSGEWWRLFATNASTRVWHSTVTVWPASATSSVLYGPVNDICVWYANETQLDSLYVLRTMNDPWHSATVKLYSCNNVTTSVEFGVLRKQQSRRDFSKHNLLTLQVKRQCTADIYPTVRIGTWNAQSNALSIRAYLPNGLLDDTQWRTANVPLKDMRTANYKLTGVETISFGNFSGCGLLVRGLEIRDDPALPSDDPASLINVQSLPVAGVLAADFTFAQADEKLLARLAVGQQGALWRFLPAENSWLAESSGVSVSLRGVAVLGDELATALEIVVGDGGLILMHAIGADWASSQVVSPTSVNLYAVSALSAFGAVAVGDQGIILTWSVASPSWAPVSSPTSARLVSVSMHSTGAVFACSDAGALLYSASPSGAWKVLAQTATVWFAVSAVPSTATAQAVVVGAGGAIYSLTSTSFTAVTSPTSKSLYAVRMENAQSGIAVGQDGIILSWDYTATWKTVPNQYTSHLRAVVPHGPCLFYAEELTLDGARVLKLAGDPWHGPALKLYCGGFGAARRDFCPYHTLEFRIARDVGASASNLSLTLYTWGVNSKSVSISAYLPTGKIETTFGLASIPLADLATESWQLWNVETIGFGGAAAANGIYFVKDVLLKRQADSSFELCADVYRSLKGVDYSPQLLPFSSTVRSMARSWPRSCVAMRPMMSTLCVSDQEAMAAGDHGAIWELNTSSLLWASQPSPISANLTAIISFSPNDAWAFGAGGEVLVRTKAGWSLHGDSPLPYAVYGAAGIKSSEQQRAWAVGAQGRVFALSSSGHWALENTVSLGVLTTLRAVSAFPEDLFLNRPLLVVAAGDNGVIMHWSSHTSQWSLAAPVTTKHLRGVSIARPDLFWAVGDHGTALKGNANATWVAYRVPTTADLTAVSGNHMVGYAGTMLEYIEWRDDIVAVPSETSADLFSLSDRGECLFYASEIPDAGVGNASSALLFTPDNYHDAAYNLYCGAAGARRDWSQYDALSFYIKRPLAQGGNKPLLQLATWDRNSHAVLIEDYLVTPAASSVSSTYQRVHIPLSALRVANHWDLGNVERLILRNISKGCSFPDHGSWELCEHYLLDDIRVMDLTAPFVTAVAIETSKVLRLTLNEPYDMRAIRNAANFNLTCGGAGNVHSHVLEVGLLQRFLGFGTGSMAAVNQYDFLLQLSDPLPNNVACLLGVWGLADESGNQMAYQTFPLTFDHHSPNANIKVNGQGYTVGRPKVGYVGGYGGDLGGLVLASGPTGHLISSKGFPDDWTSSASSPCPGISALAALTEALAFGVGSNGAICLFQDGVWLDRSHTIATQLDLHAVHFSHRQVGWVVGDQGLTARCDWAAGEASWSIYSAPTTKALLAVRSGPHVVSDTSDVKAVAVGAGGTVLHFVQGAWQAANVNGISATVTLHAVSRGWIVGSHGTILRLQYGSWIPVANAHTDQTFISVAEDHSGTTVVGAFSGKIYVSRNAGSFNLQATLPQPVYSVARVSQRYCGYYGAYSDCILWVAATGAQIFSSDDSLSDWTARWQGSPQTSNSTALAAVWYGPLRIDATGANIHAVQADGSLSPSPVLAVPLQLRASNFFLSGEDLYAIDFSAIESPGIYRAVVHGVGASDPFTVSEHALDFAAYTAGRGLYYQRCGASQLVSPHADPRFQRPPCHLDVAGKEEAFVHASTLQLADQYGLHTEGQHKTVEGGLHDAGDYGKYMASVAPLAFHLLSALDMDKTGSRLLDGSLNIPESSNGVPDVLDVLHWEVEWMLALQDLSDGGVYHKVTTLDWTQDMPHNDKPRYILAKTTHATGIHAAVLASFSRAFHAYNSTLSQLCLERAQLAWSFLQAHADPIPLGGFRNPPDCVTGEANDVFDMDERVWAAAELFRTTNAASYGEYVLSHWDVLTNPPSSDSGAGLAHTAEAYWAYAHSQGPADKVALAKQYFTNGVNDLIAKTNSNPYLNGARLEVSSWIGWGVFTYGSIPALSLLRANHFTPNMDAVNAAYLNIDAQLGANPLSRSFITGLAPRPPRRPTCEVCSADGESEPYPGIPVFGPYAHLSNGHVFYKYVQHEANNYPSIWNTGDPGPILRRYVDHPQVIPESEYTIGTMAHTYAALALLAGRPRVLLPQQNTAAQLVGCTLHVVLAKHSTAQLGAVPCREVLAAWSFLALQPANCAVGQCPSAVASQGTLCLDVLLTPASHPLPDSVTVQFTLAYHDEHAAHAGGTALITGSLPTPSPSPSPSATSSQSLSASISQTSSASPSPGYVASTSSSTSLSESVSVSLTASSSHIPSASATPAASISISISAPPSTTSTHSPYLSSIPPASPPPSTTSTHSPSHSSTPSELPASSSPLPAATTTTHSPAHSPTSSPVLAASASSSAVPAAGAVDCSRYATCGTCVETGSVLAPDGGSMSPSCMWCNETCTAVPIGTHFPIGAGQQVRAAAIEKYNVVCSLDYDPASIDLSNFSSAIAYCAIPDAYGLWDFKLNGAGAVHNSHHIENSLLIACNLAWLLFAFY
eukprot:g25821.t1